jgi:acyl-coenzyme A synthetase/AMP-(fatty) acid ligase
MNNIKLFYEKLLNHKNKIAIIHLDQEFSYLQLTNSILGFKTKLDQLNIVAGEVVFILGDYSFEAISLFFSLALNGNIIIPVTTENEQEIIERLEVVEPNWIFDLRNNTEKKIEYDFIIERHHLIGTLIDSKHSGLILFSSGSTGKPKAMVHDLEKLLSNYLDKKGKEMNFLLFLMFDHIGGLNTLFNCLSMGITMVIPQNRNPNEISKLIEKYYINILPASPTFLNLMIIGNVFESYNLNSLKMITYGTEAMPKSLLLKLREKLPKVKFLQTFGTSETGIMKTSSLSSSSTHLKFDDPNQEFKIVNGELWLRSKSQVLGYINHSNENFTKDGWFMTGDLVEEFDGGYIKIIGRSKEIINVGGEKVLPAEVESVIMELEFVEDCLVKSENNSITGQMVCADVVIKAGFYFKEIKSLIKRHCLNNLDNYKVPARIREIDLVNFSNRFKKDRKTI